MTGAWCQLHKIVPDIRRLYAQHALPAIVGHVDQLGGAVGPGVPDDGRARATAAQQDATVPGRVDNAQLLRRLQVDTVGFPGKTQVTLLVALLPVGQRLDVVQPGHALDPNLTYITDSEVAVQRLADGDRVATQVFAAQGQAELLAHDDAQV